AASENPAPSRPRRSPTTDPLKRRQSSDSDDRRRSLPIHIRTPTAHLPPAPIPMPPEHRMHDNPDPHSKSDSLRRSFRREKERTLIRSSSLERGVHPTRHGRVHEKT